MRHPFRSPCRGSMPGLGCCPIKGLGALGALDANKAATYNCRHSAELGWGVRSDAPAPYAGAGTGGQALARLIYDAQAALGVTGRDLDGKLGPNSLALFTAAVMSGEAQAVGAVIYLPGLVDLYDPGVRPLGCGAEPGPAPGPEPGPRPGPEPDPRPGPEPDPRPGPEPAPAPTKGGGLGLWIGLAAVGGGAFLLLRKKTKKRR